MKILLHFKIKQKMKKVLCQVLLCLLLLFTLDPSDASNSTEDEYYDDLPVNEETDDYYYEEDQNPPIFQSPQDQEDYWVPEEEWNNHWPPKRSDGRPIPATPEGVQEWERIAEEAKGKYKELEDMFQFSLNKKSRPYPYCVDGKLPKKIADKEDDPNLENFVPYFTLSQPRNGLPIISGKYGKTNIVHIEDGIDNGPYIQTIRFLKLSTPPPPNGNGDLHFWAHIYVNSRVPLEGLYIQAIGHPNGLPFGWFHNDFNCDMDPFDVPKPYPSASEFDVPLLRDGDYGTRKNIHVPCKYGHSEAHGAPVPTVFAYGGRGIQTEMPAKSAFRTHFTWSGGHCNFIFRAQFIILAIKSFVNVEYEAFLTPNYILSLYTRDGVPPPVSQEWKKDKIKCNEELIQAVEDDAKATASNTGIMDFSFSTTTSDFPIKYNDDYEACIRNGAELDPLSLTCPPKRTCLNTLHSKERTQDFQPIDASFPYPQNTLNFAERKPDEFFDAYRKEAVYKCRPVVCKDPLKTQPKLRKSYNAKDDPRFSQEYSEAFYGNMTQLFRTNQATHGWTMILAWFILMSIATFTARFMKEAGAINRDLGNGCCGFGFWIWVHLLLMLFAITFMWIGILDAAALRRKPVPCNNLEIYDLELEDLCRGKKKSVRMHKKIAITAVVLFHVSLIFAWTRPLIIKKLLCVTYNFRKIFLWFHILLAYSSKLIAVLSVVPFLLPEGAQVCNDLPIWIFIIEVSSICVFVGATVWQTMEDKMLKINRSHVPTLEALEPAEVGSLDYWIKVGITILSCILHLVLFVAVLMSVVLIYYTPDKKNENLTGTFEIIKGMFGTCNVTSTASEVELSMQTYYYSRQLSHH